MAAVGRPPFGVVVKNEAEYAKRKTLDSLQVQHCRQAFGGSCRFELALLLALRSSSPSTLHVLPPAGQGRATQTGPTR